MLMSEIRRVAVEVVDFRDDVAALAEKAVTLLGYNALQRERDEAAEPVSALRAGLLALDIDVLNEADVIRYMREHQAKVTAEAIVDWANGYTSDSIPVKGYYYFTGPRWVHTPIEKYVQPIPLHVIDKLVRIKESIPKVQVDIVHLEANPDPFARVWVGQRHDTGDFGDDPKEYYWIEVWEEPKFEAALYKTR